MDWDIVSDRWGQLKGGVRARWAELTDDDVRTLDGKRERLVAKVMERYGARETEAERQVEEWASTLAAKFVRRDKRAR